MSTFAVVIFPNERKAYEALHAFQELHAEGNLTVYGTNVVQRDVTGKLSIMKREELGPIGFGLGALLGGLVGLFGGPVGMAIGAAAGAATGGARDVLHLEVSDEFLETIERELTPGSFAVVAEMSEDWQAPLDTRMEALGGKVLREEREAFRDELMERRVNAFKADLARRKAEHAERRAFRATERAGEKAEKQEQALMAGVDDARSKLAKMGAKAETRLDDIKRELDAKLVALQEQAAGARPEVKRRVDQRIADLRTDLADREQKLKKAKELADEALRS